MQQVKKLLLLHIPTAQCNLQCKYCYVKQRNEWKKGKKSFAHTPEFIAKALSKARVGGTCYVNLTAGGETLLDPEVLELIELLLDDHYVEVVTNGTLTARFKALANLPPQKLKHLVFKFSYHYDELKRLGIIDRFFENVKLMKQCGCSFTIEMVGSDNQIEEIDELKNICMLNLGAVPHVTLPRDEKKPDLDIFTGLEHDKYIDIWKNNFDSKFLDLKLGLIGKKRKEFCYAGCWSLFINLGTGYAQPCYGQLINQNIFADINKPIKWIAVGKCCSQPYCYNGHAFLTFGIIPELDMPTYFDVRNRACNDGDWITDEVKEFYKSKLYESNKKFSHREKINNEIIKVTNLLPSIYLTTKMLIQKKGEKND